MENNWPELDLSEFSKELQEEIRYKADIWTDNDEVSPPRNPMLWLYAILNDIDESDVGKDFRKEIRRWMVKHGIYRAITPEELARTTTMGGSKFDFSMGGNKYVFDKHPDGYDDWLS